MYPNDHLFICFSFFLEALLDHSDQINSHFAIDVLFLKVLFFIYLLEKGPLFNFLWGMGGAVGGIQDGSNCW